jgi:hypothetical protein
MNNDVNQLYSVLFDTLKDLRDPAKKIDTSRVKLINDTAKNIIDTAKTEVDCMRVTGSNRTGSGFLPIASNRQLVRHDTPEAKGEPAMVPAPPDQMSAGKMLSAYVTRHEIK